MLVNPHIDFETNIEPNLKLMRVGILKETRKQETRVASTPLVVERIRDLGYDVIVENNAGKQAGYSNAQYQAAGADKVQTANEVWGASDILLRVGEPTTDEGDLEHLVDGKTLISFFWPAKNEAALAQASQQKSTVLAMDCVPRISRAQKLDALSSSANIAAYRAVIEASHEIGRILGGQITAAGKIEPVKVLVIGAGVAGLAAIGAASNMGAIVRAFDTRPEVKEQVESMNAEFLMLDFDEQSGSEDGYANTMSDAFIEAEMALFAQQAKEVDIIITTALIPNKKAPILITKTMVGSMRSGSVIVDMAAEQGGNCEYTVPGKKKTIQGVTILGYTDLASRMPGQSSQLYATNVYNLLAEITPDKDGEMVLDMGDEMIRALTVVSKGEVMWPPPPIKVSAKAITQAANKAASSVTKPLEDILPSPKKQRLLTITGVTVGALLLLFVGAKAPAEFMSHFTVFVLACFIGWQVVWNVTPALHTPLMSVTNAISGIIVIGALLQIDTSSGIAVFLAAAACLMASINIAGGFMVTQRMLKMFQRG